MLFRDPVRDKLQHDDIGEPAREVLVDNIGAGMCKSDILVPSGASDCKVNKALL